MSITVDISISETLVSDNKTSETSVASDDDVPEPEMLQRWAAASYAGEASAIASILVTSADEIQQLNKNYRHKDKATNVLSFPMQSPEDVDISLLGDVVLCASVINNEATQQAKSKAAHWAHMVVHGMLHLQGYDHVNQNEAEEMEQLEINILGQLGFPNPYLTA